MSETIIRWRVMVRPNDREVRTRQMASYSPNSEWLEMTIGFILMLVFALYLKAYGIESFHEKYHCLTKKNSTARLVGVVMLLIALLIFRVSAYWEICEALRREQSILFDAGGVALPLCIAIIGAMYVIFGSFARKLMPVTNLREATVVQWVFMVILMIVMIAAISCYERFFELLGYRRAF
jgi:hypothetical protein